MSSTEQSGSRAGRDGSLWFISNLAARYRTSSAGGRPGKNCCRLPARYGRSDEQAARSLALLAWDPAARYLASCVFTTPAERQERYLGRYETGAREVGATGVETMKTK